jgi:hypothetical protein
MARIAKQIAVVSYANPSLVPRGLRAVAIVTAPTGKIQRVATKAVASPAVAPKGSVCYGAVTYATQNLVPKGLLILSEQT